MTSIATTATDHYDRLLAAHYTWMLGGDVAVVARDQARLLKDLDVRPDATPATATGTGTGTLAVDLGCGPGPQSLALAELGFSPVLAIDTSRPLLAELTDLADRTPHASAIRPTHADVRGALAAHTRPATVSAVVCMGDTLTHLPSKDDVAALLHDAARSLAANGQLVLSYRDLTRPRTGSDRFLPVRATDEKIMTCFLEYADADTVMVHDLIHTRAGNTWTQHVSTYPKLRISPAWLIDRCRDAGLHIQHSGDGPRGLHIVTATKS